MDKTTMRGLLMMAAVLLIFFYLKTPKIDESKQKAATEQAQAEADQQGIAVTDSLTDAELTGVRQAVATFGQEAGNGTMALRHGAVALTADSLGHLSGTITTPEGAEVDIATLQGTLTTPGQIAAAKTLRATISQMHKYGAFTQHLSGTIDTLRLENDLMAVTFSTQGGVPQRVTLKKYRVETDRRHGDVVLFDAACDTMGFTLPTVNQIYNTSEFVFKGEQVNDSTVVMSLDLGNESTWALRYTLHSHDYLMSLDVEQTNMDAVLGASVASIGMDWRQRLLRNEEGRTFEQRNSAIYYKYSNDSPDDLDANKDDRKALNQDVEWVAFKNQFFSSVVIARKPFISADISSRALNNDPLYVKYMDMQARLPYNIAEATPVSLDFYFGPNDFPLLNSLEDRIVEDQNMKLTKLVPLGWGIFGWINRWLIIPVFDFLGSFGWNYGIIILLLTIFIKIILFPFTYKSFKSQARMRVLAPEIKEINDKYPGNENAMTRQQKTMDLYSRAGANPMSGCLPLLLQMPVLIAMFTFFPSCIELRGESFLWVKDLSAPDYICKLPFTIPFYGDHVSLFCLLMTVTNIIYTRINMQNQPSSSAMPGMKWMMYLMPVMFLFFFNDYAAGLSYYYFLSLLITIIQTYIFRKCVDEDKVRKQMMENAKKPRKKSGFMARLEEAQRQQQAMLRQQQAQKNKRR